MAMTGCERGPVGTPMTRRRLLAVAGALLAAPAMGALAGCSARANVTKDSPRYASVDARAGSDLTEASQYVEVRLAFDKELAAADDVARALRVQMDGADPDAKTVAVAAQVQGSDVVVRLTPTDAADGSDPRVYFALHNGVLSVGAAEDDGGLPGVRAASGDADAVLEQPVSCLVPSGVQIEVVSSTPGSAAAGTPASAVFAVTSFAQLRCCAWVQLAPDVDPVMMHNHEFYRDTEKTCASRMAQSISSSKVGFDAVAEGAQVTVTAREVVDGQVLEPRMLEGAGLDPTKGAANAALEGGGSDA